MAYTKYYLLETVDGDELLESSDINALREQRDNPATNIPQDGKIYSYDLDEQHPDTTQRMINRTLVE